MPHILSKILPTKMLKYHTVHMPKSHEQILGYNFRGKCMTIVILKLSYKKEFQKVYNYETSTISQKPRELLTICSISTLLHFVTNDLHDLLLFPVFLLVCILYTHYVFLTVHFVFDVESSSGGNSSS